MKMNGEGASQCNDLSEICHTRGPDPQPSTGLISVLDLEVPSQFSQVKVS